MEGLSTCCEKQDFVSFMVHVDIVMVLQFFSFTWIAQEQEFGQESCGDFLILCFYLKKWN